MPRRPALLALCAALMALPAQAFAADPPAWLSKYTEALPGCGADVERCLAVELHVASPGEPVQPPGWLATQLREANRHFAPVGVGFQVVEAAALPSKLAGVKTPADRDRLGKQRIVKKGRIHVFLVESLADIDIAGEVIRGVHWRLNRRSSTQRWIILSAIAPSVVLAHELGHFFGLGHSKDPATIMNKSPRSEPDPKTRTFTAAERKRIHRKLKAALRSGLVKSGAKP